MVSYRPDPPLPGEEIAFLHRMDSVEGDAVMVATDRARLSKASFLDGRETFWSEQRLCRLAPAPPAVTPATRFVFHVGFAGSTLLARLLDWPGHVVVLKEPQCLADLAGQRELIEAGKGIAPIGRLLDYALAELGSAGGPDVPVVVKPTNWVNGLLPELCAPRRIDHALFVSMDARHYLGATFRGGNERLAFCARLASSIAPVVPRGAALLERAIASTDDPFGRMARIMAVLHWLHESLFDRVIEANGWPDDVRIDFADLLARPDRVLQRAQEHLALPARPPQTGRAAMLMKRHTKDPASAFRPAARAQEDEFIEQRYGARFDEALAWLDSEIAR